jgi:hypothetical protein
MSRCAPPRLRRGRGSGILVSATHFSEGGISGRKRGGTSAERASRPGSVPHVGATCQRLGATCQRLGIACQRVGAAWQHLGAAWQHVGRTRQNSWIGFTDVLGAVADVLARSPRCLAAAAEVFVGAARLHCRVPRSSHHARPSGGNVAQRRREVKRNNDQDPPRCAPAGRTAPGLNILAIARSSRVNSSACRGSTTMTSRT